MTPLQKIGVLAHPLRPQTHPVAKYIADTLQARHVHTWMYTQWTEPEVQEAVHAAEIVIAIGGDGALLRAARVCAPFAVPVLGYNMGQLGFLTEISGTAQWEEMVDRLLNRQYWIEERMMLSASILRGEQVIAAGEALNDVVVSGSVVGRMIQLETYIDKDWATTYNADALIISTPTGSTAYALACGGPILPPELHNILILPAAPHLSMNRPLVLAQGVTVDILATSNNQSEIMLTVDGAVVETLLSGDQVRIQASQRISRFIRLRERNYFYRSLLDRLEPRIPRPAPENRLKL